MRANSASVSSTSAAPRFSWIRSNRRDPGMGTMCSPLCSIQASETCAGVAPFSWAKPVSRSSSGWLARMLSRSKPVMARRTSSPV
jgi:hypothetical protein